MVAKVEAKVTMTEGGLTTVGEMTQENVMIAKGMGGKGREAAIVASVGVTGAEIAATVEVGIGLVGVIGVEIAKDLAAGIERCIGSKADGSKAPGTGYLRNGCYIVVLTQCIWL